MVKDRINHSFVRFLHMVRQRPLTVVTIFIIVLAAVAAASIVFSRSPVGGGADEASAADIRATVTLRLRTIDADMELRGQGRGVKSGIVVSVREQSGRTHTATSNASGLISFSGVDAGMVTVSARQTGRYVAFPFDVVAQGAAASGKPVDVPLYREDQQWLAWGRGNDRRRVGPAAGKPRGKWLWNTDPGNNMEFPPSLAYGLVVYGSYHGYLCADYQANGKSAWRVYPGDKWGRISKFANQVAVSSWVDKSGKRVARVFYADLTGIVGCRDLFTGREVWEIVKGKGPGTAGRQLAFRSIEASPLVQGNTLYFCTRYNNGGSRCGLWALDRDTGRVRWFRKLARTSRSKIGASPAYAGGRLFVATYDGYVYALRASNGKVLWRKKLGGQFYSTPAVYGSRLFVGNKSNGRVYCLNTRNGRTLWRSARIGPSVHGSPAVDGGKVFIGSGRRFYALRVSNGKTVWRKSTRQRVWGSASVLKGVVYYSDFGHTYARSGRSGKLVWKTNYGRYSPVTATRHLIVVCDRKSFYAYLPSN